MSAEERKTSVRLCYYVRDQITGWAQGTSIAAKAGLILHWAAAHWGKSVRSGGWE